MSQVYVNGPAEIWIGTSATGALSFLGWSQDMVHIVNESFEQDVPADFSFMTPADTQFGGETASVSFVLTVWNESVYSTIAARVNGNGAGRGSASNLECGNLYNLQNGGFRLLIFAPYSALLGFSTMPAAYNYPLTYLQGANELDMGTRYKTVHCTMRCLPQWDAPAYSYTLYNTSVAGKGSPN